MKGQSSMEFLAMVSLSAFMLAGLYGVMVSKQIESREYQNSAQEEKVADYVSFQVEMALVQGSGYSRVFSVPENIGGDVYTVRIFNGTSYLQRGNNSAIKTSRYYGDEINITAGKSNVFRVVNRDGEVKLVEE